MKTNKELSVDQEHFVAYYLGGRRTKASGAAKHDPGDVVAEDWLVECKLTRAKTISVKKNDWDKIRDECHTGRSPLMALRFIDENDKPTQDLVVIDRNDFLEMLEIWRMYNEGTL